MFFTKNQLKALKVGKILCDRVFHIKPDFENLGNLDESTKLKLNNIEYISQSLRPILVTMDQTQLGAFPSKISNLVKIRAKGMTPARFPKILIFYHPARTELRTQLKNVASYFDLQCISLESCLVDQREKLKNLGPNSHEVLTKLLAVPDEVCLP